MKLQRYEPIIGYEAMVSLEIESNLELLKIHHNMTSEMSYAERIIYFNSESNSTRKKLIKQAEGVWNINKEENCKIFKNLIEDIQPKLKTLIDLINEDELSNDKTH